jgi:Fur family ferric uptake transcriptional regulator
LETNSHREQFLSFLQESGLRCTSQRMGIVDVFLQLSNQHPTLEQLLKSAQENHPEMGYATVYRTMKLLVLSGLAYEHRFADQSQTRFELDEEGEHHDHIICVLCGHIVEFENEEIERIQDQLAVDHGFKVLSHRHEIYGECQRSSCTGGTAHG